MKRLLLVICVLSMGSLARAQTAPSLGTAATFAVVGSAVTCTGPGVISGDVGATGAFTNTPVCTIAGGAPPATNTAAGLAQTALITAYQNALVANSNCTSSLADAYTGPAASFTLGPGVYCNADAAGLTFTNTTLTLNAGGNANAVWVFKISGAGGLTGTSLEVVMANGGQPCNVYWLVAAGSSFTTSTFQGNILAGGATGAFTSTGGTLIGRVLVNGAVTMTGPNIHGTCALAAQGGAGCKNDDDDRDEDNDHDRDDHHKKGHHHKEGHDKDKDDRDDDKHKDH